MAISDIDGKRPASTDGRTFREASAIEGDSSAWSALDADDPEVFARGWLAIAGRSFPAIRQGTLFMLVNGNDGMQALAAWGAPGTAINIERLKQSGTEALTTATEQAAAVLTADGDMACAAIPVLVDDVIEAMVLMEARLENAQAGRRLIRHLQWSAAWIEAFLRRHRRQTNRDGVEQAAFVVQALESVSGSDRFVDAARALAGLVSHRFQCGRVALGVRRGLKSRLVALAENAEFESRTEVARAFEAAMDEAIDQETALAAPPAEGALRLVAYAQEALRGTLQTDYVLTIPVFTQRGAFGALVLTRSGTPFTQNDVDLLDAIAVSSGGALAARHEADRGFLAFVGHRIHRSIAFVFGSRMLFVKLLALAIIAGTAALALIHDTYRVTAPGEINGEARRALSTPFDGYLQSQFARAGDVVKAGTVIAELQDNDLVLNRLRNLAARRQTQAEHDQALAKRDLAQAAISRAALEQKDAELALDDAMLERSLIRTPFDAVVVSGDLSQSIGKPVNRGEVLFELAPLDRYRVTIDVPESAIGAIRKGQQGQLLLTALPERPFAIDIVAVTPVARVIDGVNSFEVLARLIDADERVRPSMEGTAKIDAGEASLLWISTHTFFDWLRIRLWSWLP